MTSKKLGMVCAALAGVLTLKAAGDPIADPIEPPTQTGGNKVVWEGKVILRNAELPQVIPLTDVTRSAIGESTVNEADELAMNRGLMKDLATLGPDAQEISRSMFYVNSKGGLGIQKSYLQYLTRTLPASAKPVAVSGIAVHQILQKYPASRLFAASAYGILLKEQYIFGQQASGARSEFPNFVSLEGNLGKFNEGHDCLTSAPWCIRAPEGMAH